MKKLLITRWGIGGPDEKEFVFEDEDVLVPMEDGNVSIQDADENVVAFYGGIAEARWVL